MKNRHPVDELADVRAERKRLEEREARLRAILIAEGADLVGEEHVARVTTTQQHRLDRCLLEERFGPEAIRQCTTPVATTTVRLESKERAGANCRANWRGAYSVRANP